VSFLLEAYQESLLVCASSLFAPVITPCPRQLSGCHNNGLVCKLNKAIYSLKQAPKAWFERLSAVLLQLGFKSSKCDPSLFVLSQSSAQVYVLVYVDDIIIIGSFSLLIQ